MRLRALLPVIRRGHQQRAFNRRERRENPQRSQRKPIASSAVLCVLRGFSLAFSTVTSIRRGHQQRAFHRREREENPQRSQRRTSTLCFVPSAQLHVIQITPWECV